jgi:uncharacterized protein (DUF58 family)
MLVNQKLLQAIKKLQIKTDRLTTEILSGEYKTAFRGKGLNFDTIREYQIGDDIRLLDWKVTARMGLPFVRQYKEERQLCLVLILDLSASNKFGTQEKTKQDLIIELAAVLASLAIKNTDKVGVLMITDEIETFIPPKSGKSHIFRMIKELLSYQAKSLKTDLKKTLSESLKLIPANSVVFLISDFLDMNFDTNSILRYEKELKLFSKKHDFIAISIRDPREFSLPNIGYIEIANPETNSIDLVNLNRKAVREIYNKSQSEHLKFLKTSLKKLGIDFLDLRTDKSYIPELLKLFLKREKRF